MKLLLKNILVTGLATILLAKTFAATPLEKKQEQAQLLATLQAQTNLHAKVLACKRLAVIGDEEAVPVLATLLKDDQLHHMARFALEPNPSPLADKVLRDSLDTLKGKLLIGAINSIGVRRDSNAIPQLTKLLKSTDEEIAGAAGAALARIGTPECAKALKKSIRVEKGKLKDDLAQSAILCAERLYNSGKKNDAIDLFDYLRKSELPRHIRMAATRGAILSREEKGLSLLLEQLSSNDDGMFAIGLRVVREFSHKNATKELISLFERMKIQKTAPVKLAVFLEALGECQNKDVSSVAVKILQGEDSPVMQLAAVKVIGKLGDESAVDILLKSCLNPNKDVSQAAYNCLITLGGKNAEQSIATAIDTKDDGIKLIAIKIASERNISSAIPNMLRSLNSADKSVRLAAITALGTIGTSNELESMIGFLVSRTDNEELNLAEQALSSACSRLQDKDISSKAIIGVYPTTADNIKPALIKILAQTPTDASLELIRSAMKHANPQICEAAARALCDWQSPKAIDDIFNLISEGRNQTIKILAIRGAVRLLDQSELHPGKKTDYLKQAFKLAQRDDEKRIVLSALGNCPTLDALKLTSELLTSQSLKNEAAAALISISQKLAKSNPAEVRNELKNLLSNDFDQLTQKKAEEILNSIK